MTPEEKIVKALAQKPFTGEAPDDETLARYIDGNLDREQHSRVTKYLASHPDQRHRWRLVQEQRSLHSWRKHRGWTLGLASAATVLIAALIVLPSNEPAPPDTDVITVLPQTMPAELLASNAVPKSHWQAFLHGYSRQNPPLSDFTPNERAWQSLGQILAELRGHCDNDSFLQRAQREFDRAAAPYPTLKSVRPTARLQWCQLGETLKQKAHLSVNSKNDRGDN